MITVHEGIHTREFSNSSLPGPDVWASPRRQARELHTIQTGKILATALTNSATYKYTRVHAQ